jgi:hypothetical protein
VAKIPVDVGPWLCVQSDCSNRFTLLLEPFYASRDVTRYCMSLFGETLSSVDGVIEARITNSKIGWVQA